MSMELSLNNELKHMWRLARRRNAQLQDPV